jgi:DNA mismatch repair protein MLH3
VLHVLLPAADVSYTHGKSIGHQDEEAVQHFVLAVVDEFLQRHEFVNPAKVSVGQTSMAATAAPAGRTPSRAQLVKQPTPLRLITTPVQSEMLPPRTPCVSKRRSAVSGSQSSLGFPQSSGGSSKRKAESFDMTYEVDDSGRKRYKWIDDILAVR